MPQLFAARGEPSTSMQRSGRSSIWKIAICGPVSGGRLISMAGGLSVTASPSVVWVFPLRTAPTESRQHPEDQQHPKPLRDQGLIPLQAGKVTGLGAPMSPRRTQSQVVLAGTNCVI